MHPDQFYRVALSRVPHIGNKLFRHLLTHFGTAEEVFRARPAELRQATGIGDAISNGFERDLPRREAERILLAAEREQFSVHCYLDADYPRRLTAYTTAPAILYHRGTTDLQSRRSIAIVGTREISPHGPAQVERLLQPLAEHAPLIVSGLAYGVDYCAHNTALRLGLPTLGVLGSGFQCLYPAVHAGLARRMARHGGGVLTEYPFWIKPNREHFPARNRIVAMQADLTLVVESGASGGSMITARMARELGRPLGACPGPGGAATHAGCNLLIKTGQAHLIEDGTDIIQLLNWSGAAAGGRQRRLFDDLSPPESAIVGQLRGRPPLGLDELRRALSLPPAQLAATLLNLELMEVVVSLPGGQYRLTG